MSVQCITCLRVISAAVAALCIHISQASAQPSVQDLGTLGGTYSTAWAINDAGQVVGHSAIVGDQSIHHPFFWTPTRGMLDLGTSADVYSEATAINNKGQVVGFRILTGWTAMSAFSWTPTGGMVDLGTLGATTSAAFGVNDKGQVVGELGYPGTFRAFSWTRTGGVVDLGTLGGTSSSARAINNKGQVVGYSNTAGGEQHAFSWTPTGGMVDLGTLGGTSSTAWAVNNNGQVVGSARTANGQQHAFSWTQTGGMVDLGPSGSNWASAQAINDLGEILIWTGGAAFSWTPTGGAVSLDVAGVTATTAAFGINRSGQIVGSATFVATGLGEAALWSRSGSNPRFSYIGAGDSVAAGQDIDGKDIGTSTSPFAYPKLVADALCSAPPPGVTSCNDIFFENIAVSGDSASDFLQNPDPRTGLKGQFQEIKDRRADLVTATIGIDGIMVPAVECIIDAERRFHFLSNIRTSAYISAVAAGASGCLTGLFLSIDNYLDAVQTSLATIGSGLIGLTPANAVLTTYYNPVRTTGIWSYIGRTFADFIGSVNSFVALQVVQNPSRLALADLGPAFLGHEIGTSCSYIERLNNLPLLPFGVHPNRRGQRIIAGVVLKAARDKGFISGPSLPVATCITGLIQPGQLVTLSGLNFESGMSVSIQGTRTQVVSVSSDGFNARLRVPNRILVGIGSQVDVLIKNPRAPAANLRVEVTQP